jgi:hypothetical protein
MRTANAKLRFEAEQKLIRFEHVIKLQMAEIAKLRTENKQLLDWILGTTDALTCLQAIYQNPESSEYSKIKAAYRCPNVLAGHLPKPGIERIQQDQSRNWRLAIRTTQVVGGSISSRL